MLMPGPLKRVVTDVPVGVFRPKPLLRLFDGRFGSGRVDIVDCVKPGAVGPLAYFDPEGSHGPLLAALPSEVCQRMAYGSGPPLRQIDPIGSALEEVSEARVGIELAILPVSPHVFDRAGDCIRDRIPYD